MSTSPSESRKPAVRDENAATLETRRVVLTMGGKGGTGKTTLMTALAEWYQEHGLPFVLLDLDTENKARGSVSHFFRDTARKVNIHTPAGLDAFVDHLVDTGDRLVLADMGAGSGQVATQWFEDVYEDAAAAGIVFTAIGLVTPDPASVESVLSGRTGSNGVWRISLWRTSRPNMPTSPTGAMRRRLGSSGKYSSPP